MTQYIWTNGVMLRDSWLPELRKNNPLRPAGTDLGAICSLGCPHDIADFASDRNWNTGINSINELEKTYKIPTVPCIKVTRPQTTYADWTRPSYYDRIIEALTDLMRKRGSITALAFDLEFYGTPSNNRRYPYIREAHDRAANYENENTAMAIGGLINYVSKLGLASIFVTPGISIYAATMHMLMALPNTVLLSEDTYMCPFDDAYWQHYDRAKGYCLAVNRRYLPGFYAGALRMENWRETATKHGVTDCFYYPRDPEDNPQQFWSPTWAANNA